MKVLSHRKLIVRESGITAKGLCPEDKFMGRDSREKGGEIGASPTDPRPGFVSVYDVPRGRARPGSRGNWLPASRALGEGAGARSASDRPPRFLGYLVQLVVLCGVGKLGNESVFWALAPEFRCYPGRGGLEKQVGTTPILLLADSLSAAMDRAMLDIPTAESSVLRG